MKYYDLAVIGAGSAAAYYLSTVDRSLYPGLLVVGGDDPWKGERGDNPNDPNDPVNFVNHTPHMIDHYGNSVPTRGKKLYKRSDWANANQGVIDACSCDREKSEVDNISEDMLPMELQTVPSARGFRIELSDSDKVFWAKKVVLATGAGSHSVPPDLADAVKAMPNKVMDMDAYAKLHVSNKKIVVIGPNAPIDTVDTAVYNHCEVTWLIRNGKTTSPLFLATGHQNGALTLKDKYINYDGTLKVTQDPSGGVKVEYTNTKDKKASTVVVDYVVYGTGQSSKAYEKLVDASLRAKMQPLYDKNQRFGNVHESVVGFEVEGTDAYHGFEVVGALSTQVAKGVDIKKLSSTYLNQLKASLQEMWEKIVDFPFLRSIISQTAPEVLKWQEKIENLQGQNLAGDVAELEKDAQKLLNAIKYTAPTWPQYIQAFYNLLINYALAYGFYKSKINNFDINEFLANPANQLTGSVAQGPQLGTIRSATAAQNGFMPAYVSKNGGADINYSQDDRTMMRVFIAVEYPYVSEDDAQSFIRQVIAGRKKAKNAWGYDVLDTMGFRMRLRLANLKGIIVMKVAKTVGTGKTPISA
jgi:thioredoxin reductase